MGVDREKLLSDAMEGDHGALQHLLLEDYSRLAAAIRSKIPIPLQSSIDEEDILQTTFIQVFRDLSCFKMGNAEAFFCWTRSIAQARVTDAIRSATRKKRGGDWKQAQAASSKSYLNLIQELSGDGRSPSQSAAAHEATAALQVALADLADDQRQAVQLRYIDNLSLQEVSEYMGRSEPAVRGLLHRGKAALKLAMGRSAIWFSDSASRSDS